MGRMMRVQCACLEYSSLGLDQVMIRSHMVRMRRFDMCKPLKCYSIKEIKYSCMLEVVPIYRRAVIPWPPLVWLWPYGSYTSKVTTEARIEGPHPAYYGRSLLQLSLARVHRIQMKALDSI